MLKITKRMGNTFFMIREKTEKWQWGQKIEHWKKNAKKFPTI
jgi:hypothetical protein